MNSNSQWVIQSIFTYIQITSYWGVCGLLECPGPGFCAGFCCSWSSLRVLLRSILDYPPSKEGKEKSILVDSPAAVAAGVLRAAAEPIEGTWGNACWKCWQKSKSTFIWTIQLRTIHSQTILMWIKYKPSIMIIISCKYNTYLHINKETNIGLLILKL